jgi:Fe-S-cluster containining protein
VIDNPRNLPILRTEVTESFCSICPDPGHCCRSFYFHKSYWKDEGLAAAQKNLTDWGNPFIITGWQPKTYKDENGREYAEVICTCPKVTPQGLCSIYEDRPRTCRIFAAGSDPLCVFSGMSGIEFNWRRV